MSELNTEMGEVAREMKKEREGGRERRREREEERERVPCKCADCTIPVK